MYTVRLIAAAIYSTGVLSINVLTGPAFLSVAAFRVPARVRNSSSERPPYLRIRSGLKAIGQKGIPVVGRVVEVDGVDVDVDGVGVGVRGSVGYEATKCRTASRNTSTIFSISRERNCSISGSVRGWLDLTFWQCDSHCSGVRALSERACSGVN